MLALGILLSALPHVVSAREADGEGPRQGACGEKQMGFDTFVRKHRRSYKVGSKEYNDRKALFEQRSAEARAHNCRPGQHFWKAGATTLSDRTEEELAKTRGRKGSSAKTGQKENGAGPAAKARLATLETQSGVIVPPLPSSVSWEHLEAMNEIFDQGACGSCWASATAVMLRAHTDIYQQHQNLSVQQLVSCVPNPEECGGSGGCNGSTGELALDYVYYNGLRNDLEFPYEERDVVCPDHLGARHPDPAPQPNSSSFLAIRPAALDQATAFLSPASSFGMVGWSRLPANKLQPLYHALYREGPVAVSIVAGYAWNAYVSGIMNNCSQQDMVVNHLVVLIGYGTDDSIADGTKYWHIQNSWGDRWGEDGKIRMIRKDDAEEESFCGMDTDPLIGTGCKGGPSQVWVCGSCGILFDNVVAHFQGTSHSAQLMLQRRGQQELMRISTERA